MIKAGIKSVLDASLVRLASYVQHNLQANGNQRHYLHSVLWERAVEDSANYVQAHISEALVFAAVPQMWNYTIQQIARLRDATVLEFGVFNGSSINYFSQRLPQLSFYGFDSFEGLAQDWKGHQLSKGAFSRDGKLPAVNSNVTLVKGWFDQTLPVFVAGTLRGRHVALVHVDADTHEAADTVLKELRAYIKPGLLILFDEYLGYPNWRNGEFLAWQQFWQRNGVRYRYLAFGDEQALVQIT